MADEIFYRAASIRTRKGLLRALPAAVTSERMRSPRIPGMPPYARSIRRRVMPLPAVMTQALAIDYEEAAADVPGISDTHFAATWLLDPRACAGQGKNANSWKCGDISKRPCRKPRVRLKNGASAAAKGCGRISGKFSWMCRHLSTGISRFPAEAGSERRWMTSPSRSGRVSRFSDWSGSPAPENPRLPAVS